MQMRDARANLLGIYLSVPFCRSKCTYCNFASGVYPASEHTRYVERVIEDLHGAEDWTKEIGVELPRGVDTVYLGGGTPSLLEPELLARLFAAMRAEFAFEPGAEITVECAPGQIGDGALEALVAAGVNRVSLGVQSFVDSEARGSGRMHSRAVVEDDLRRLRGAGIANLNVDLIAGLAGQTLASWEESLEAVVDAGTPHASVYMLEVDEDSRLGREMLAGGARYHAELVPGDDAIARMYERAQERLDAAGVQQYEISNFGRAGLESRHNLRYWERRPYLGLGLDASSALLAAEVLDEKSAREARFVLRATTSDDLKTFLERPETKATGKKRRAWGGAVETAWLGPERQHEEAWFLGLRLNAGVDAAEIEREFGAGRMEQAAAVVERMVEDELLERDGGRVRLTERGRMLSNDVFQEFLDLAACGAGAGNRE
jgi:oxygen-independent coproporphyrinogen-3 oxidase